MKTFKDVFETAPLPSEIEFHRDLQGARTGTVDPQRFVNKWGQRALAAMQAPETMRQKKLKKDVL